MVTLERRSLLSSPHPLIHDQAIHLGSNLQGERRAGLW